MINGQPARAVSFFIDGNDPELLPLVGDGLLAADIDGKQKPKLDAPIPLVGTQDDGGRRKRTDDSTICSIPLEGGRRNSKVGMEHLLIIGVCSRRVRRPVGTRRTQEWARPPSVVSSPSKFYFTLVALPSSSLVQGPPSLDISSLK